MYNEEETVRPYVRALVQAAQTLGVLGRVREDMDALATQWEGSEVFRDWAHTFHSMPRSKHRQEIDALWGDTLAEPTRLLLEALSENGLMATVPQAVRLFRRMADRAEGRVRVAIEFAVPPEPTVSDALAAEAREAYGEKTEVTFAVNPKLGAGIRIRAGHTQIDGSLTGRLKRLSKAFKRTL